MAGTEDAGEGAAARRLTVWLPMIRAESGTDIYTRRLAAALEGLGHRAIITEYAHRYQLAPWLLGRRPAPAGTDVTVTNSWSGFAFARPGIPMVTVVHLMVHDPAFARYRGAAQAAFHRLMVRPMERASVARAARVVAVSANAARLAERLLGARDVAAVLNGVDTGFFTPPDERPPASGRPMELLFVGNFSRRKGADLLPAIMDRLGDAALLRANIGLRADRGFAERANMKLLGRMDQAELRDAYRRADLLLFPSRLEGFGYVAAEALACGTPVVASDISALPEVVPDGRCGILCPVDDADAFAGAVRTLAGDPARLARMRQEARAHAVAALDSARWAREMEAVLLAAVSRAAGA